MCWNVREAAGCSTEMGELSHTFLYVMLAKGSVIVWLMTDMALPVTEAQMVCTWWQMGMSNYWRQWPVRAQGNYRKFEIRCQITNQSLWAEYAILLMSHPSRMGHWLEACNMCWPVTLSTTELGLASSDKSKRTHKCLGRVGVLDSQGPTTWLSLLQLLKADTRWAEGVCVVEPPCILSFDSNDHLCWNSRDHKLITYPDSLF